MCTELATQFDTIREEYWNYISRSLTLKYGEDGATSASTGTPAGGGSGVHTADYIDKLSQIHANVPGSGDTGNDTAAAKSADKS